MRAYVYFYARLPVFFKKVKQFFFSLLHILVFCYEYNAAYAPLSTDSTELPFFF